MRGALVAWAILVAGGATAADKVPQLFVAGDSTASEYKPNPKNQQGWGAVLQPLFDESKLRVVNVARGGRSSRTFITEGHWDRMLSQVNAGDFVIIQFGHNDSGALNQESPGSTKPLRARGTIPGIGNESEEIDNVVTGQHETVYSYGWYLRKMIADTRAKGATPILLTLTKTNHWKDGRIPCDSDTYRLWTRQTATAEKVAFIDLTRIIGDRFQRDRAAKIGFAGLDPGREQKTGERGQQRAQDIGQEQNPLGVDAREVGRPDIAADRVDVRTQFRSVHQEPDANDRQQGDHHRHGNAEHSPEAEEIAEIVW